MASEIQPNRPTGKVPGGLPSSDSVHMNTRGGNGRGGGRRRQNPDDEPEEGPASSEEEGKLEADSFLGASASSQMAQLFSEALPWEGAQAEPAPHPPQGRTPGPRLKGATPLPPRTTKLSNPGAQGSSAGQGDTDLAHIRIPEAPTARRTPLAPLVPPGSGRRVDAHFDPTAALNQTILAQQELQNRKQEAPPPSVTPVLPSQQGATEISRLLRQPTPSVAPVVPPLEAEPFVGPVLPTEVPDQSEVGAGAATVPEANRSPIPPPPAPSGGPARSPLPSRPVPPPAADPRRPAPVAPPPPANHAPGEGLSAAHATPGGAPERPRAPTLPNAPEAKGIAARSPERPRLSALSDAIEALPVLTAAPPQAAPPHSEPQAPAKAGGPASSGRAACMYRVVDLLTDIPVARARIEIEPLHDDLLPVINGQTDSDGWFRQSDIPPGEYRVAVRAAGYVPVYKERGLAPSSIDDLAIFLAKP
ncbi:MAG: carboxypeptidase regulatory-like domain-containing protein [Candidatus Sericytochromatia bacterium]|nr:carboxypeptidase regulatory-like domain-containing protein [Candidatus Sericytochromatia bacterium]